MMKNQKQRSPLFEYFVFGRAQITIYRSLSLICREWQSPWSAGSEVSVPVLEGVHLAAELVPARASAIEFMFDSSAVRRESKLRGTLHSKEVLHIGRNGI